MAAHGERASHAVAADAAAMCAVLRCRLGVMLGCGCGSVPLGSSHANNDVSSVYDARPSLPHAETSPEAEGTAVGILHL